MQASEAPLSGIRVVEFSHMVMGPVTGAILDPMGEDLVAAMYFPDTVDAYGIWPGANSNGQTQPCYLSAVDCGISEPTAFADIGFDVDISPMFQTPEEAAKMAVENDVHVVGVSSLAAGHKALVPQLINVLKEKGGEDIKVVVGGVIPPADYDFLYQAGAKGVFGPGTVVADSANKVLNVLEHQ